MKIGGQRIPIRIMFMLCFEAALMMSGLVLAAVLRFHSYESTVHYLREPHMFLRFGLIVAVCQISFYYYDLYDFRMIRRRTVMLVRMLQALGLSCIAVGAFYYLEPD